MYPRLAALTVLALAACAADTGVSDPSIEVADDPVTELGDAHAKGTKNYDLVFDDTVVRRLDLTIAPEHYEAMQADMVELYGEPGGRPQGPPGAFAEEDPIYVPVNVDYEGETWGSVAMRYKGNSSLQGAWSAGVGKLPFRLHFDKYEDEVPEIEDQRFWGFKELKFSSAYMDDSLIRDKLASDILRGAGVPTAQVALVRVHVDVGDGPVFWGVYGMAEDPCGSLLDSWFGSDDGNCYKPESALSTFAEADFEKKTNEDEGDFTDVITLVDVLADSSVGAPWRESLEAVFDVEGFLRYLAVHNLVQNWDAYGVMTHNYFLYGDPDNGGRLTWIPWDFNEAFQQGNRRGALSLEMDEVSAQWPLIRRVMDDEVYAAAYAEELAVQLETGFDTTWIAEHAAALHTLVAPFAAEEASPYTFLSGQADFEGSVDDDLIPTIEARAAEARGWVGAR